MDEPGKIIEPRKMTHYHNSLTTLAGIGKVKLPRGWKPGKPLPKNFKFPEWIKPPKNWKPGEALPEDFKLPKGINFHALRHTFATRALENGIPPKIVQEILGHTSITMTLDLYTHVLPETKKDAIQKLKGAFKIG